jgi:uroporphyrin-3 C-methyltransferase
VTDDLYPPVPKDPAVTAGAVPVSAAMPMATRLWWLLLGLVAALGVAALMLAWKVEQRSSSLEQELVRRQQDSAAQATEARLLAKQAQDAVATAAAKVSLLEARVAEVAVQRSQLEDLIQSMSRSRDENLLGDTEAAIRVAMQQGAITGSAEPLVAALKQSDERLARHNEPRLEGVRRAIARDLDRVKATSVPDIGSLGIKLDEAIRMVDDLPLLAAAEPRRVAAKEPARVASASKAPAAVAPAAAASAGWPWLDRLGAAWSDFTGRVWSEVRGLVRVTRIDQPEAMLVAPEQAFFIRENLKLRLLNARLALLSRQYETAQADLHAAQIAIDRYFDRSAKRTVLASELIRQVVGQARHVGVPRPDDTLAALTAAAGR